MISLAISFLVYVITREISRRYTSSMFQRIGEVSLIAIFLSLLGAVFSWINQDTAETLESITMVVLWFSVLHLWGMRWPAWMKIVCLVAAVCSGIVGFIEGRVLGEILVLIFAIMAIGFAYVQGKQIVPYRTAALFVALHLLNLMVPNIIWRSWEGIVVLYALMARLITYLHAIYHQSITDRLTGLYNRVTFIQYVEDFMKAGRKVGVIFMDIDNFKNLNDERGHSAGDDALRNVAALLKGIVRDIGVAARYGGEEMVAVIVDWDVVQVANELCKQLPIQCNGITASIGVAQGKEGMDVQKLIGQADDAMYQAKKGGKNQVVLV